MESREILQLTIELAEGSDILYVFETDEPAELAVDFCKKHNLDMQNVETLTNLIEQNIDLLIEAEKNSSSPKPQLVRQAQLVPSRKRPASPQLITQARTVHEVFSRPQPRRPSSTAPSQKKIPEKDNINRYGIKTPSKIPKVSQRPSYDKLDQYFALFELLNPNTEGKISAESLAVPALPVNMMQIITPMINELKTNHKTIGFSEFTQAMDKIINNIETGEKAMLLEINQRKEYSFPMSKQGKMTLYERQMLIRMKNEEKLKEKRQVKQDEELRECKFRPQVRGIEKNKY